MHVRARCFALLRELATDRCDLDLTDGASVGDAWDALVARYPAIAPHREYALAARNGAYADWDAPLTDGDEVAFLPPVSGGADPIGITDRPIDLHAFEGLAGAADGAVVIFIGRARDRADDGREVLELEYEAYPEMAESVLREIVEEAEAEERWSARVAVLHRVGVVPLGETAVAIVSVAPHRGAAYEANRFVIEAIKQRLPIWKRERFVDGSEWKRPGA